MFPDENSKVTVRIFGIKQMYLNPLIILIASQNTTILVQVSPDWALRTVRSSVLSQTLHVAFNRSQKQSAVCSGHAVEDRQFIEVKLGLLFSIGGRHCPEHRALFADERVDLLAQLPGSFGGAEAFSDFVLVDEVRRACDEQGAVGHHESAGE